MKNNNRDFLKFCLGKIGTPYVMGTNGKALTQAMYNDLVKRNPSNWFTAARLPKVRSWIGKATTDCHGLIEWFAREQSGKAYDVTADMAFASASTKGKIATIPELPGICVRYPGHVGIYLGNGYVLEARGFDYGTCITKLKDRNWVDWYRHPKINYAYKSMEAPKSVSQKSGKYEVAWMQLMLNKHIAAGHVKAGLLTVDGEYGKKTIEAILAFRKYKNWSLEGQPGTAIGVGTIKALQK